MRSREVTRLQVCGKTDVGEQRTHNEDSIIYFNKFETPETDEANLKGNLYIVADGMGGHSAGEVASNIAVNAVGHVYYESVSTNIENALTEAIQEANRQIYDRSQKVRAEQGMGTTIVAAVIRGDELYTAHVGDSRLYLIRDNRIVFVTEDHSWVQEQVRNQALTEEEAHRSPMRHVITRSLGNAPEVEVETNNVDLEKGDIVVLCSDGLWEPVGDEEIIQSATQYVWDTPELACEDLARAANRAGGPDNISVIVIGVEQVVPVGSAGGVVPTTVRTDFPGAAPAFLGGDSAPPAQRKTWTTGRVRPLLVGLALLAVIIWSLALVTLTGWWVRGRTPTATPVLPAVSSPTGPNTAVTLDVVAKAATREAGQLLDLRKQSTEVVQAAATSLAHRQSTIEAQDNQIATLNSQLAARQAQIDALEATAAAVATSPAVTLTPPTVSTVIPTAIPSSGMQSPKTPLSGTITVDTIGSLQQLHVFSNVPYNMWVASVAIAPDDKVVAAAGYTYQYGYGYNYIWKVQHNGWSGTRLENLPHAYSVAFSTDGNELAIGYDRGVAIVDKLFTKRTSRTEAGKGTKSVSYSDHFLAAGGESGVFVWPIGGNNKGKKIFNDQATSIAFSSDGTQLAIGGADGSLRFCPISSGEDITTMDVHCEQLPSEQGHRDKVWGLTFTPDGKWLAAGSRDGLISIWDTGQRQMVDKEEITGNKNDSIVNSLAFSRDGRLLVAATQNGVAAWEFKVGTLTTIENLPFPRLRERTGSVAISNDGKLLVIGFPGRVELWGLK